MKTSFNLILFLPILYVGALKAQLPVLNDPEAVIIGSGFNFVEGPVWKDGVGLLFSDIPENKVYLFDTDSVFSEYFKPSGKSNGLAIDSDGNLILCQHLERQVGIYRDGAIETLASHYNGKRLNSPNDLTIKSNGVVYFTDPDFGLNDEGLKPDLDFKGIYCITADGKLHLLDKSLNLPNGICFSPDEEKLYVVDSQFADIYVWDVVDDTTIINKTLFYNNSGMWGDGMKTDENGFLYATANNGLSIISPGGSLIKRVTFNGNGPSNCNWGSSNDEPILYITAGKTLWKVKNKTAVSSPLILEENAAVSIYPNPSSGNITFDFTRCEKDFRKAEVYDVNGILIFSIKKSMLNDSKSFTRNFQSGVYILKTKFGHSVFCDRFIIE